ncbi:MAG: 23S rRNA (pseudouridine(1915)-N(3))-methyltransferase RlmH [Candidatus Aminicenantes bacterium]|nr:23S rRNA (pseudouridine(1915)-N(3))-methyltransferase RlmH [Candidatus Aminicenantes bacterium]
MRFKILWPGKTRNKDLRAVEKSYLEKINRMGKCEVFETKEAKGISEKNVDRIKKIEAAGLEKFIKDDYIICLYDQGKEMSSKEFTRFLGRLATSSKKIVCFVVGGFMGLEDSFVERAHSVLSLSKMTFSHELCRLMLLEQIYRSLSVLNGRQYAK